MPDQLGDPPATLGMGQQAQQLELVAQVAVAVVVVEVVRAPCWKTRAPW